MKASLLLFLSAAFTAQASPAPVVASAARINADAPYPECHASTIVESSPGKLVAAWFGGTRERDPDVCIHVSRMEDGKWLPGVEVASGLQPDGSRQPTWNPVLFAPENAPLHLFYKVGPHPSKWWGMVMTSNDGGKTWGAPRRLPEGILGPVKNKPVVLADGSWLSPSSSEGGEHGWVIHFERSRDGGRTWEKIGPVGRGPEFEAIQPSILFHKDGSLQAMSRTKQGVVAQCWSRDLGETWSSLTATALPNPNSGADAVTLADGRQLIIYNHSSHRPDEAKGNRWPLDVAISDDGIDWKRVVTLETEPCKSGYAYPAVIQAADGKVHITYTVNRESIKHVVLDPGLLAAAAVPAVEPEPGQAPPHPVRMDRKTPAFPGAWGGGMFTSGGRGGRAIAVTSLNDRGPGTLRAAIDQEGPRTVVFRVAGMILLESDLNINHPDITIAGQSAPGDGICIAHHSLNINTRNVILRHLRIRRGDPIGGQGADNIGGNPESDIIVDHCSVSWGRDEGISLYRHMKAMPDGTRVKHAVRNLTIQWVMSSEALGPSHAFGGTWGGEDATFHHNLFACNTCRNPSIGMSGRFDFRNNVIHNWGHRTLDGGDETSEVNVINNYYKAGPATDPGKLAMIARIGPGVRKMYSPGRDWAAGGWYPETPSRPGKWYVAGNVVEGHPEVTADNWKGLSAEEPLKRLARVNTPFTGWPVRQESALEAYHSVLAKVGATRPRRDAVDSRVIAIVRTNKTGPRGGIVHHPDEVGGYPDYAFVPDDVPPDSDGDGMSDVWEIMHNLDPTDSSDGSADSDGDGFTNLEEFLNNTRPREKTDYLNLGNNIDTVS